MGSGREDTRRQRRIILGVALCSIAATAIGFLPSTALADSRQPSRSPLSLAASDELGREVFSYRQRQAARKVEGGEVQRPSDNPTTRDHVAEWLSRWGSAVERRESP
jgi:hypothetical protein